MKKLILSILFILLIVNISHSQVLYGQGGAPGIRIEGNNLVVYSESGLDSFLVELPTRHSSSVTMATLLQRVLKVFDSDLDSLIADPSGFNITNSAVAGALVFQLKDGESSLNIFSVDSTGKGVFASTVTSGGFTIGNAAILEAELEILDGATLSTSDINIIDGISDSGSLTAAELLHVDGVTSAIQTQFAGKSPTAGNTSLVTVGTIVTGIWNAGAVTSSSDITATNDVITDSVLATTGLRAGNVAGTTYTRNSSVTNAEFAFINTLSSNAQDQINGKQSTLTNSAGLAAALNDETGTGLAVFGTAPTFASTITVESDLTINPTVADGEDPSFIMKGDADSDGTAFTSEAMTWNLAAASDPTDALWTVTSTQSTGYSFDKHIRISGPHVSPLGLLYLNGDTHALVGLNSTDASQSGFFFNKATVIKWVLGSPPLSNGDEVIIAQGSNMLLNKRLTVKAGGDIRISKTSATNIVNTTSIGELQFFGEDNTTDADTIGGQIEVIATATWTDGAEDAKMVLNAADGGVLNVNQLVLNTDGSVLVGASDFETVAYNRSATLMFNDCFDRAEAVQYAQQWDITALNVTGTGTNVVTTTPSHITLTTDGVGIDETEGTRSNFAFIQRARKNRSEWCVELGQTAQTNFYVGWNDDNLNAMIAAADKYVIVFYEVGLDPDWQIKVGDGTDEEVIDTDVTVTTGEHVIELWTETDGTVHLVLDGSTIDVSSFTNKMEADNHYLIVGQLQKTEAAIIVAEIDFIENEKHK